MDYAHEVLDRSTALLRLNASFEPEAAANGAWRTA
jgi:hypothetical protein